MRCRRRRARWHVRCGARCKTSGPELLHSTLWPKPLPPKGSLPLTLTDLPAVLGLLQANVALNAGLWAEGVVAVAPLAWGTADHARLPAIDVVLVADCTGLRRHS